MTSPAVDRSASEPEVSPQAPAASAGHPRRWWVLGVLMVSLLLVVLDTSILNVALKTIAQPAPDGLGASQSDLQWSVDSYTLVFAAMLFTTGLVADWIGRKKTLIAGLLVFGGFSVWSAYSHSAGELITARAGMGIGGALVMPATLAIIVNVFPPAERSKAISLWAASAGVGVAVGPITGGLLLEHFWWGSVFLINIPIVVAGAAAALVIVPESRNPGRGGFDPVGVVLSITGLGLLVFGVIKGGDLGDWANPEVWGTGLGGLLVLALFVLWERRSSCPAMDVGHFRNRQFSGAVSAIGLVFFGLMGATFFIVFYLQSVRGYSALKAGCCLLPLALGQVIFSAQATAMVRRFGVRPIVTVGMLLNAGALGGMALLGRTSPIWMAEVLFFFLGAGVSYVMPPATSAVMATLPPAQAGTGSAVNNTFRQVGGALGVAVLGSVLSSVYRHRMDDKLAGVPAAVRNVADQSIESTLGVAARVGARGGELASVGKDSFMSAMHLSALVAAGVMLAGALVAVLSLGERRGQEGPVEAAAQQQLETLEA